MKPYFSKASKKYMVLWGFVFAFATLAPKFTDALTPIARWDVVPNQRINNGDVLNVGVVAFSKAGIDRVSFTVSGQGFSGATPRSVSAMTYNEQTKAYEYWFPLKASDFSSNGVFTLQANAYGKDGGTLALDRLSFVVNATGTMAAPKAWVSATGNNSTGKVGDRALPFKTLGGAISKIQASNGGSSDGATVYFLEGSYSLGSGTTSTTNEWLTVTKDSSASKANTIITDSGSVAETTFMRLKDITIKGSNTIYLGESPAVLWADGVVVQGGGRYVEDSNPIARESTKPTYITDTEIYDADFGATGAILVRNATIKRTGNDISVNNLCMINTIAEDQDPGTSTYWHGDGYQSYGKGPVNRIIYNFYGTNLHCQGLFVRQTAGYPSTNNAFVNVFMEMREPGRASSSGGDPTLVSGAFTGSCDHVLVWNCSFPYTAFQFYDDDGVALNFTNSSFIGNLFYEYVDYSGTYGQNPTYSIPGNSGRNDFLNNHYIHSRIDEGRTTGTAAPPSLCSRSPDSGAVRTHTYGDPKIDLTLTDLIGTFGVPNLGSPLLDRISPSLVPTDALGRLRGETSDIGALERTVSGTPPSQSPSKLKSLRIKELYP
jgi:hypothetical protein